MTTILAIGLTAVIGGYQPAPDMPALVDAALVLTHYDPALSGINCAGDCDTFGSGETIQQWHYNTSAACPTDWRGMQVVIDGIGSWRCRDSGGAVVVHWTPDDGYHGHVDVLRRDPVQRGPFDDWQLLDPDAVPAEALAW